MFNIYKCWHVPFKIVVSIQDRRFTKEILAVVKKFQYTRDILNLLISTCSHTVIFQSSWDKRQYAVEFPECRHRLYLYNKFQQSTTNEKRHEMACGRLLSYFCTSELNCNISFFHSLSCSVINPGLFDSSKLHRKMFWYVVLWLGENLVSLVSSNKFDVKEELIEIGETYHVAFGGGSKKKYPARVLGQFGKFIHIYHVFDFSKLFW